MLEMCHTKVEINISAVGTETQYTLLETRCLFSVNRSRCMYTILSNTGDSECNPNQLCTFLNLDDDISVVGIAEKGM
jgi:hypothetical protein